MDKVNKLTAHHFISKHQSAYLSKLEEELTPDEVIIILDFAENYSFIVQDAAQGYHWDKTQATLRPFVAYMKQDGETKTVSMCVISDHLRHDTITVHCFLEIMLSHVKLLSDQVKKVYYLSDGAASQYKTFIKMTVGLMPSGTFLPRVMEKMLVV